MEGIMQEEVAPQTTETYYRAILDSIPLPIFLVDEDLQIHELNDAAKHVFGLAGEIVLKQRGGDVLHCLHATETPQGCGHASACSDCVVRNSVASFIGGG
jgi:PAS domain S-box-containing protein